MAQPADYSQFQTANSLEPLTLDAQDSLLQDADPALFYALDYYTYLINTFPGPRLLLAASSAGMGSVIQKAVAQSYPWPPDLTLQETQFRFPLLAMYRKTATYRWKTASWEDDVCTIDVLYVLPPLTGGQNEAILPILRAVEETIRKKTTMGFDPGYTPPGGTKGEQPWTLKLAGVESIGFERGHMGTMPGTGTLKFPFLLMEGYIVERDMYVPGQKFAGGDIEVDLLSSQDGSVVQNFINLSTQQAPTVTSVGPNGGPIAGGTSVNITGTLFLPAPQVFFGPQKATGIIWNSATSITAVSPAVGGPGTVGVSVLNRDGQSGSLANAFTFS